MNNIVAVTHLHSLLLVRVDHVHEQHRVEDVLVERQQLQHGLQQRRDAQPRAVHVHGAVGAGRGPEAV